MLAMAAWILPACAGESDAVRIGTEGTYPPFNFINEDGEIDGLDREVADELCGRADLECSWVTNKWDTIISNLVDNKYDVIIAGMYITDERDEIIDFTQAYVPASPSVYIAMAGAGDEAVNGAMAVQLATVHDDYLTEAGIASMRYSLSGEVIDAVLQGTADVALVDLSFAVDSIEESGGKLAIVGPEVMIGSGIGIGVREDDSRLRDKLDRAIGTMKEDGTLNALIEKWLGPEAGAF